VRLLLASRGIPGLAEQLQARGRRPALVPTAANPLGEPGIAAEVEQELTSAGLRVERLDLDGETAGAVPAAVLAADLVAVSGGDPFHLLAAAPRTGFGEAAAAALAAGTVYVGHSAGAMVAGPTLVPTRLTASVCAAAGARAHGLGPRRRLAPLRSAW
jgi:dipeptidase E